MTTIRDEIEAWGRPVLSSLASNTEAYNHVQKALEELREKPWAQLVLGADMDATKPEPPAGFGDATKL